METLSDTAAPGLFGKFVCMGDPGIRISLAELAGFINEQTPELLLEDDIKLRSILFPVKVKKGELITLEKKNFQSIVVNFPLVVSMQKKALLSTLSAGATLNVKIEAKLLEGEEMFQLTYLGHTYTRKLKSKPINLSFLGKKRMDDRLKKEIPALLQSFTHRINEDLKEVIKKRIVQLRDSEDIRRLGLKNIQLGLKRIESGFADSRLNVRLVEFLCLTSETEELLFPKLNFTVPKSSIAEKEYMSTCTCEFELREESIKEQIPHIIMPAHRYELKAIRKSKKRVKLEFANTKGIVGDVKMWFNISIQNERPVISPHKIKFKKKLIKFVGEFNWTKDLLLEKARRKLEVLIGDEYEELINRKLAILGRLSEFLHPVEIVCRSDEGAIFSKVVLKVDDLNLRLSEVS